MRAKVWWKNFQRGCPRFSPIQPNSTSASCRWTNIPTVEIFLMFLQSLAWKVIPPIHGLFKQIHSTFGEKPVKVTPKGHQSTWFQIQRRSRLSEICTGQGYFWHDRKKKGGESTKMPCVEKIERDRDCLYRKWKEPRGKIPSMSLLIFSKRRLNKKEKYFTSSSSSQSHPWSLCNVNWVGSEEVVVVGTDSKSSASLRPKMHL